MATPELLNHVTVSPAAKFVMVHCEYGFTTNLPIDDFFGDDCLFALKHNGQDLTPDHGYPLRLVVPKLYAWKSAKWVRAAGVHGGGPAGVLGELGPRRVPHARRPVGRGAVPPGQRVHRKRGAVNHKR